ncbi:MAG: WYL domain-containing protein [Myxococcota bacterium]
MSAARTERLLNLLTLLLNTRRAISLREIRQMDEFGAYNTADPKSGERAFERDKAALVELGVPLRWIAPENEEEAEGSDGLGGYVIDRDRYYLPEMTFEPGELALLSMAAAAALTMDHFPGRAALIHAMAKLGFDIDEAAPSATLAHTPTAGGDGGERIGNNLEVLHDAIGRRLRVAITYRSLAGKQTQRQVDPYGLYYRQGVWYLVGLCHLRGGQRTFHLGRMDRVVLANKKSTGTAEFDVPPQFNIDAYVRQRPWEYPHHEPINVTIRLAQRLVPAIREIFGRQVEVLHQGNETLVTLQVSHRQALISTVLPYGSACEVVAPLALRDEIGQLYESLARRYAERGSFEVAQ